MTRLKPNLVTVFVLAGVTCSLTVSAYYLMRQTPDSLIVDTFNYGEGTFEDYGRVRREWRPRVGSTLLVRTFYTEDRAVMSVRIGWYFAFFFLATSLVYFLIRPRSAVLMMLATFAALFYSSTPAAEQTWHPWDMPALLAGAVATLAAWRGSPWLLATVIVVAVPFKETVLVLAVLFLFFEELEMRRRLTWAAVTIGVGYGLRLFLEVAVGEHVGPGVFSYHINDDPQLMFRLHENLLLLFTPSLNHVIWANCGLLLLLFLIPSRNAAARGIKWTAAVFYAALMMLGSINEFRVFFEILPGSALLLDDFLQQAHLPPQRAGDSAQKAAE